MPGNNHTIVCAVQASVKLCAFKAIRNSTFEKSLLIERVEVAVTGVPPPRILRNRNCTNAMPVGRASVTDQFWTFITESTQERSHTSVRSVARASLGPPPFWTISGATLETSPISAMLAGRVSVTARSLTIT